MSAFAVGQLSERLYYGYISSIAGGSVLDTAPGGVPEAGFILHKAGTSTGYYAPHFLELFRSDEAIRSQAERTWAIGAIITLADALDNEEYFDHEPELELVYHLRNAVAHGNKFTLTKPGLKRLDRFPAHNRLALVKSEILFEITPSLNGQPALFDFMAPGDVLDLLQSVGYYLVRVGNGDLPIRNWL